MQIRAITAALIFFGSYFPLAVILLVQDIDTKVAENAFCNSISNFQEFCVIPLSNAKISITVLIFCSVCFGISLLSLKKSASTNDIKVIEAKHIPADLMSYVFPYIVSFMSFDYQSVPKMLGALIFLIWMFFITYRSGNIVLNPLLAAFGWKLYEVKFRYLTGENDHQRRALCKDEILPKSRLEIFSYQDVLIAKVKGQE